MIDFTENVEDRWENIDLTSILNKSIELLKENLKQNDDNDYKKLLNLEIGITKDFNFFGMHSQGSIKINCRFIAYNLTNYLLEMNDEVMNIFLDYFIEGVIVHEIHHAYMYYYELPTYNKYKKHEDNQLYSKRPLEIQADEFMKQYMSKYNDCNGEKIAELLIKMRTYPNGQIKQDLIKNIVKDINDSIKIN